MGSSALVDIGKINVLASPISQTVRVNLRLVPVLIATLPFGLTACGGGVAATAEPGDEFCELAADAKRDGDDIDDIDFENDDANDIEDAFTKALESSEAAAAKAPKDIADDIAEQLELQTEVVERLDDYNFDLIEAIEDEDLVEVGEDLDRVGEDVDEYLEDKCEIENDADEEEPTADTVVAPPDTIVSTPVTVVADSIPTGEDDPIPDGVITRENFLDFYAIGAGVEITQEMKDCFAEETSGLTEEEFTGAVNETSDAGTTTIGLAFITCGIPLET
jgi:hypothetical protein